MVDKKTYHYCPYCGEKLVLKVVAQKKRGICSNCGFIDYVNAKPAVGALILNEKKKILLGKRAVEPGRGLWNIVGGFLEDREYPIEGLKREVKEETGLEVEPYKFFDFAVAYFDGLKQGWNYSLNILYFCRIISGKMLPADDVTALKYFSLDKLPRMAFEHEKKILTHLREYLQK